ncbi:MAG: hypothetical protein MZU91_02770 [Desulfosudis oleivorans]|nr:hypothetical protein [Desulfosudis oleivorans]
MSRVSLGMDARLSSPAFKEILKKGLTESGVARHRPRHGAHAGDVLFLFRLDVDGGIEVTGSAQSC